MLKFIIAHLVCFPSHFFSIAGGSAGVLLVLNGDIMGASGIMSNSLINPIHALRNPKNHWRYVFIASFALSVNLFVNYFAVRFFLLVYQSRYSGFLLNSRVLVNLELPCPLILLVYFSSCGQPSSFLSDDRAEDHDVPIPSTAAYLLGGLLVGLGTRVGNGCTTGTFYFDV